MLPHMDAIRNTAFQRETHRMLWNAFFIYFFLPLSEMQRTVKVMWNVIGVRFWFLIVGADCQHHRRWQSFSCCHHRLHLDHLSLHLVQVWQLCDAGWGWGVTAKAAFQKVQWHCCLRHLFYTWVTCVFNLSQQVPMQLILILNKHHLTPWMY